MKASTDSRGRFQRLEQLFHELAELEEDQRREALQSLAGDDAKLRDELSQLLAARDAEHSSPGAAPDSARAASGDPVDAEGRYRLRRVLGEGGMGTVWEADQVAPIRRRVAVKVVREGVDGSRLIRRFQVEQEALARMAHPNIASVFDAGLTTDGRPFFSMELVDGERIDAYCDRRRLDVRERLAVFRDVCGAVSHAHQLRVVHRDLKPSNILVQQVGEAHVPKVIDFGIAKSLDLSDSDSPENLDDLTRTGERLGTPAYMSPEQLAGEAVDERSDVFALGIILYELLAGCSPFRQRPLLRDPKSDPRVVGPPPPSRWIAESRDRGRGRSDGLGTTRSHWRRELRGDLDALVLRATEPSPERRYPSARELLADVERFLRGERLSISRSFVRRAARTAARHRLASGISVAALVGLLGGVWLQERRQPAVTSGVAVDVTTEAPVTVAVLPFEDHSTAPDGRTAAALTDALTDSLARVAGLRVTDSASTESVAQSERDGAAIGRALGVGRLVEGRLTRVGERVVVDVVLRSAETGARLWNEAREVDVPGLWTLPSDLATSIARQLEVAASDAGQPRVAGVQPSSEAIDAYQRGRFFWSRRTPRDFALAARHFRTAIELEPDLALAHAGLADTYIIQAIYGLVTASDAFDMARPHVERALELDPGLAEALTARAAIELFSDWDLEGARGAFEQAVAAGPSFTTARLGLADALLALGRFEEGLEQIEIAVDISPFDRGLNLAWADLLLTAGELERAASQTDRTLEIAPEFAAAHLKKAEIEAHRRDGQAARARLNDARSAGASPSAVLLTEAVVEALLGDRERALERIDGLDAAGRAEVGAYALAQVFAWSADRARANEWLARAASERSPSMIYVSVSPAFAVMRDDPDFRALVRRLRLETP